MKFLLLALVFFFIGCSDSIDVSYNDDAYEEYLQEKLKKGKYMEGSFFLCLSFRNL